MKPEQFLTHSNNIKMKIEYLYPRDEIIEVINRGYQNGMITTSGDNLSILDNDGSNLDYVKRS